MKTRIAFFLAVIALVGCATRDAEVSSKARREEKSDARAASSASTYESYKRDLAQHICHINADKVHSSRPQALLRSVVVVKYVVDAHGNLVKSEVLRSNHDRETESTALMTLRNGAPFPQPASHLLRQGRIEISETWLFNNDGRFQLRTIAQPQMGS